jgi:SM-20-related protein
MSTDDRGDDPSIGAIVERLSNPGWAVVQDFLPAAEVDELAAECQRLWEEGELRHAGVGTGAERTVRPEIRSDRVLWLTEEVTTEPVRRYLGRIEALRRELNRHLYLGLFDFEAHFTVYPPGAFYRKHLDRFRTVPQRTVSAILYLNRDWTPQDGGQLRIYLDPETTGDAEGAGEGGATVDVVPRAGTLAIFLSERFWHEVLPAERERMSVTGWLKTRA